VHELPKTDVLDTLARAMNTTTAEATHILWNAYHPYEVWLYLGIFGVVGIIGMSIFYLATRKVRMVNDEP
jgi:hypothetical protein